MKKTLIVLILGWWLAGCCGDLEMPDAGTDAGPAELRCVDDTGTEVPCDWEDPRCVLWYCTDDEIVCCPRSFAFGCAVNVCGASETACEAAGYGVCSNVPAAPVCGIACDGTYPVPCVVDRPEGTVWTCAVDVATCEGIPGTVCE